MYLLLSPVPQPRSPWKALDLKTVFNCERNAEEGFLLKKSRSFLRTDGQESGVDGPGLSQGLGKSVVDNAVKNWINIPEQWLTSSIHKEPD